MKPIQDYYDIAQDLLDTYAERNTLFTNMEKMFNYDWDFPEGIPDWVLKVVSTDPRDAVMTTVRTFSTVKPHFKIMPMLNDQANRDRANEIETAISYNFYRAGRRMDGNLAWDVMLSATLYAMVAAQVIYLPYQEKILGVMGKDTRRVKAAKRYGDFAFIVHNPANIYPQWSEYGLEGVMTARIQTYDQFVDSWGNLSNKIEKMDNLDYVTVFDYINYDERCVWVVCGETEDVILEGPGDVILHDENKLGFIPFAISRWGNSLSDNTAEQVMPLLQSVEGSGQWDMLNVFDSLDASLAIKRAARPSVAGEFPPGQSPEMDNTQPEGVLELPQGTRNFTPLPSQSVDNRLATNKLDFKSRIWQSTVAKALQTLEFPSGTAYSSVNQILSTAANSLASYRMLGEKTFEELAHQMLCWVKYYGKEYEEVSLNGKYEDKTREGQSIAISSKTLDPDTLEIHVTLTADLPVDKLQQINGAVLVKNNFSVPEADLLEDLGYGNPVELSKRRKLEDMVNVYYQTELQKIQQAAQLEFQQQQMMMQMQAQQAQQQQQMQMQQQAQQAQQAQMAQQQQAQANAQGMPANENLGGQGFNPAMGGVPPVQGARGQGTG